MKGFQPSRPTITDRIADITIVFFIALGLSMPLAVMVLSAFWVVGQAIGTTVPFTFSSYVQILGFFTVLIWGVWVVNTWSRGEK